MAACKSSTEDVPLRSKPVLYNFDNPAFCCPADDDDSRRGPAHVVIEGGVAAVTDTACCSSDDRLPVCVGDDTPPIVGSPASRRRPSMLRRIRAFFARSS